METIINIDRELFLILNHFNHPLADEIMLWITNKWIWTPLYAFLVVIIVRDFGKRSLLYLVSITLLIILTDQLTSSAIKPLFERWRPCHDPAIASLTRLVTPGCGSLYGFVSGHAANSYALASFLWLLLGKKDWSWLMIWAGLVAYSRIYVGVHFPIDVMIGGLLGFGMGIGLLRLARKMDQRIFNPL